MAKRKLSKQQKLRIEENQQDLQGEQGLLVARYGKSADVLLATGQTSRCSIRQNLPPLVVGDQVIYQQEAGENHVIVNLLPRQSELSRLGFREEKKLIAANLTQLLIVIPVKPMFDLSVLDSYLAAAELSAIEPVIIFNKVDLLTEQERADLEKTILLYKRIGYQCFPISCLNESDLCFLSDLVTNENSAFVGPTGAGKSSLTKFLFPEESIALGAVSEANHMGKHTTTTSQLFFLAKGGQVIDSPGVRGFNLKQLASEDLFMAFKEFAAYQGECKFRDCKHLNDPGCALRQAIADGKIAASRLSNALKLMNHD